ncbi:MAG: DUF3857 domain-containing protein [Deltaproteobacteria bacterium]|nr:DUF3857 domain-containing protein [Deltaproteobacteria bacterium]
MKKGVQVLSIVVLASLFFISSCTLPLLRHKGPTDDEISQLIRTAPPADAYPDAPALVIFDQDIIEVFPDASYKATYHKVIKVLAERGKRYGDIRFGFNSRMQKVKILHAKTTTPDGETIPLKENAIKIVTPYSWYPEYSDYKQLTFSMPGVLVGSVIDYEILLEGKPSIKDHYSDHLFSQGRSPILLSRHKVILPKDKELKYLALHAPKGIDPSPLISYEADKKVYLWEFRDIPQILDEG